MNKWYHGSPIKKISQFRIDLPRYDSLEGQGVYLTQYYPIARGYAGEKGSVYEVMFEESSLLDLTSKDVIRNIITIASEIIGEDIFLYNNIESVIEGIHEGRFQISPHKDIGLGWQVKNILLNDEGFCSKSDSDELAQKVENTINAYIASFDAWKYDDSKLGIVVVIKNPNILAIIAEMEYGSDLDLILANS